MSGFHSPRSKMFVFRIAYDFESGLHSKYRW